MGVTFDSTMTGVLYDKSITILSEISGENTTHDGLLSLEILACCEPRGHRGVTEYCPTSR